MVFPAETESVPECFHGTVDATRVSQSTPRVSLTAQEAARATGFSENYIRLLIAGHSIPHVRVGRAIRVMVSNLERFLEQHRVSVDAGHRDRMREEAR
jgi:excisionase family DNA binding protein